MASVRVKVIDYPGGYKEIIINDNINNNKNNKNGGRKKGVKAVETREENIKRRIYRVKRDIKRLALANGLYRLMTLTFRENVVDVDIADKYFSKFIYALRVRGYKVEYIMVRERQERGAIHYHVLISDFLPFRVAFEIWNNVVGSGSVNFKYVGIKGIFYCIKYIEKAIEENIFVGGRGYAKKVYSCSKGLKRPEEICMIEEIYALVLRDKKLVGPGINELFNKIEIASREKRIVYMNQGNYGPKNMFEYRCLMIAPRWDRSYKE